MEAATWNGPNIQRTSTRLGLRTEASGRFEKQLQPEQGMDGQALAAKLMIELCGARPVGGTIDVGGPGPRPRRSGCARPASRACSAPPIPRAEQAEILERLGFGVADADDGLDVTVPYWRRDDVTREADLVEEVGRIWGFERLPLTLPSRRGVSGRLEPRQRLRRRAEDALVGRGLSESLGWSFAGAVAGRPAPAARGRPAPPRRAARQPDVARSSRSCARRCSARCSTTSSATARAAHEDVRLWERGAVYLARDGGEAGNGRIRGSTASRTSASTSPRCSPAACARRPGATPDPPRADFFAAKGVLGALLDAIRVAVGGRAGARAVPAPGPRGAGAGRRGEPASAGSASCTRPSRARWDLERAAGFEVDFGVLAARAPPWPASRT